MRAGWGWGHDEDCPKGLREDERQTGDRAEEAEERAFGKNGIDWESEMLCSPS